MKKNIIFTLLILLTLTLNLSVSAEDSSRPREEIKNMRVEARGGIKEIRQDFKGDRVDLQKERREQVLNTRLDVRTRAGSSTPQEMKVLREQNKSEIVKIRADFQKTIKQNKASTTEAIKIKRENLISGVQEKREIFKKELEARKEARASTTALMKTKFKAGLEKIKDEKKKIRVENVAGSISDTNTGITTKATENINRIETVLITIESRADKAAIRGENLTTVRTLISNAEAAIAVARTAITNQVSKVYSVSITDESTVKTSLQNTRDLLKKDVEIMNTQIRLAHEATRKAAGALKVIPNIKDAVSTEATTTVN